LRGKTRFVLNSEENYQALYDFLLDQSGVEPGKVGKLKVKSKDKAEPLIFPKAVKQQLLDLAKFIDRPKEAHHHVITELQQNRIVKACFFLTASKEDKPMDFGIALRERLKAEDPTELNIKLLRNFSDIDCTAFRFHPWDEKHRDDFIGKCLLGIGEALQTRLSAQDPAQQKIQIFNVLKNKKEPTVLFSDPVKSVKKQFFDFGSKKLVEQIDERFLWITQINTELESLAKEQGYQNIQPLVLLFCLKVEASLLTKVNVDVFVLQK